MKNQMYKARCYESHPPLSLGGDIVVYGGSCGHPIVHDADIYVGFDYSMAKSDKAFPWVAGESFLFPITDMRAPSNAKDFINLIEWLSLQLTANKKVHLGCIGGHGRTGTVLAALVAHMMGRKDAIEYVRTNYCQKAVESNEQIRFLMDHFGVSSASPSKGHHGAAVQSIHSGSNAPKEAWLKAPRPGKTADPVQQELGLKALPTTSPMNVWGQSAVFDKRKNSVNMPA